MEQPNTTKIIHFDSNGDQRLLVDDVVLVVSSKAMSLVSRPWKAMLDPGGVFLEALPNDNKPVPFLEDNLVALTILLHITHLQFNMVPLHLKFQELLNLAILTDKYQATGAVSPWLERWLDPLKETVGKDGYEEWLWIAWEFGLTNIFQNVASKLVLESRTNSEGDCVTESGKILTENMPPDIIESILNVRKATIQRLLETVYGYVDMFSKLDNDPVCKCSHEKFECHSIMLGSLVLSLQRHCLWPVRADACDVRRSVIELCKNLEKLDILQYPVRESYYGHRDHSRCKFGNSLKTRVQDILGTMPAVLLDSHKRHLEAHRLKLVSVDS